MQRIAQHWKCPSWFRVFLLVWLFGIQRGFCLKWEKEGGRPRYLPAVGGGRLPLRLLLRRGWGGVGCLLLLRSGRAVGLRSGSTVGGDRLSLGLSVALGSRLDLMERTIDSAQNGLYREQAITAGNKY